MLPRVYYIEHTKDSILSMDVPKGKGGFFKFYFQEVFQMGSIYTEFQNLDSRPPLGTPMILRTYYKDYTT